MDYMQIVKDARDPNSKDNSLRLFWAKYQQVSHHVKDRNIICFPMKVLETNVKRIAELAKEIRLQADKDLRDKAAKEALELVEKSLTTMDELLKL
jgi:hypothetical protein